MPEATWKPHEKHGRLTMQSDLPDSVYAFPKQRKEPLTDAQHVRNAVARFDQVIDVSDADRALAFANIEKLQTTTASTSRKRPGTTFLKRAEGRLPPKVLWPVNAERRAKNLPVRESVDRRSNDKVKWKSQPTKTKLEKETEYDRHKRSDRSV
jgi:hypothetical protein